VESCANRIVSERSIKKETLSRDCSVEHAEIMAEYRIHWTTTSRHGRVLL